MGPLSVVELRVLVRVHLRVFDPEAPPQLADAHHLEEVEEDGAGAHEDHVAVLGGEHGGGHDRRHYLF